MAGGSDIYDDIIEQLQENGDMDQKTFRRSVLLVLVDLGRGRKQVSEIKKKVELLERNSLLLQARKHPGIATPIILFFAAFIISVIAHLELWAWLFNLLGIPVP